ncbi:MAG: hypothetical protein IJI06_08645 [Oscillospiraceae bacterium]|nr:hypothetical protein [Oscillospiraceae bacterium]
MSAKSKAWLPIFCIQYFADGASGGDGGDGAGAATTVDNAADDGRDNLEALGVPREAAERHRARMEKKRGKTATPSQSPTQAPETASLAGEPSAGAKDSGDEAWDAFFSDQAHKDRLEQMMSERGKKATEARNAANAQMEKLSPMIKLLGEKYGVKPNEDGSYDVDSITKAMGDDDSLYEEKALEMGVTTDVAKQLAHAEAIEQQQREAQAKAERDAMLQEHFNRVRQQGMQLKEKFPDFDLDRELQNPEFVRRTAPGALPVEDAYLSLHAKEIMQRQAEGIARRAKQTAAQAVQSGSARPRENGSATTAAAAVTPNMRAMSRADRLAYIKAKYPSQR